MKIRNLLIVIFVCQNALLSMAQSVSYDIKLNQIGFLPNAKKLAAVINTKVDSFEVKSLDLSSTVYKGQCLPAAYYSSSEENVSIADFTLLKTPGNYVLVVKDLGKSVPFTISNDAFTSLSKASIKAFYYNRASIALTSKYAGVYARAEGHPDTAVIVLPSASSAKRPVGTIISTPGGWYDAGDYNKYIVNSGISTFTLLSAYETYSKYFDTLSLNIPKSNAAIPDILDEALWNIKWMMSMQDTTDGGVYNKTTEAQFSSFEMPSKITSKRYVTAKSTAATLDFAAIMAMTSRIYKKYDLALSQQALKQAIKAWQWAKSNPKVVFTNPAASGSYPAVGTGEYSDTNFEDEFSWCAAELYITTKESKYYSEIGIDKTYDVPGWPNVKTLGLLSLNIHADSLTADANIALAKSKLIDLVENAKNNIITSPYRICGDNYYWGGNNAYANMGMLFMQAFKLTKNASYFNAALSSLDYLLGRNATSYCFVTGMGTKSPMDIHHRISGSDGIANPIPGLLVGGPNAGNITDCGASKYVSLLPAKAYADLLCSYSTNEIAINWNAPLAFLAGAIECEYLNNFTEVMPVYFSVSSKNIALPSKSGKKYQVIIEGNTDWSLSSSSSWIDMSVKSGTGSAVVQLSSNSDNSSEQNRMGKILIYNQGKLTDSIAVTQNGLRRNFRIEAEDYTEMLGLQTETTSDSDGVSNLGYVDANDWATYNIDVSFSGIYELIVRHAGYTGDFDISIDGAVNRNVAFPATAGWQEWESYNSQLSLTEGQHVMKLTFNKPGTNLNWFQLNWKYGVGINSVSNSNEISVYPVPASSSLTVDFGSVKGIEKIELLSVDGKVMYKHACKGTSKEIVNISNIKEGLYILKAYSMSTIYTQKIMVEK